VRREQTWAKFEAGYFQFVYIEIVNSEPSARWVLNVEFRSQPKFAKVLRVAEGNCGDQAAVIEGCVRSVCALK
jgi:hypothetical protein